ncbi:hypothetical protein ACHAW6_011960 [Cyclotella cf. meneghiniana]
MDCSKHVPFNQQINELEDLRRDIQRRAFSRSGYGEAGRDPARNNLFCSHLRSGSEHVDDMPSQHYRRRFYRNILLGNSFTTTGTPSEPFLALTFIDSLRIYVASCTYDWWYDTKLHQRSSVQSCDNADKCTARLTSVP